MATTRDAAHRNKMMRAVKSKGSSIETTLAKALWAKGYRYRLNYKAVLGKPDIVFTRLKVAVFCDSEFWHGKNWNTEREKIKNNLSFWEKKIQTNVERDQLVTEQLRAAGWVVLRFWGNDIKKNLADCVNTIENTLKAL
jgi:DNA mismatch endonuclease Vsr